MPAAESQAGVVTLPGDPGLPGRAAILGFARSGQALARALAERGVAITVGDARPRPAFPEEVITRLEAVGARFFFDGPAEEFLDRSEWLGGSPGVPLRSALGLRPKRGPPVAPP